MPYRQSGAICSNSGGILSVFGPLGFAAANASSMIAFEALHRLCGKGNEVFRLPARLTVG